MTPDQPPVTPPDDDAADEDFEAMLRAALGATNPDAADQAPGSLRPAEVDVFAEDLPEGHKSGFVAVVGRPNVGKSTLINALIGEKVAIVSPKPQTTRLRQLGILTTDQAQIIFIDTPGVHQARDNLGHFMVDVALHALRDADVVLFITDISRPPNEEDQRVAALVKEAHQSADNMKILRVLNKIDLHGRPDGLQDDVDTHLSLTPYSEWSTAVATEGAGVPDILNFLVKMLPEGPRFYPPDQISDIRVRDMVAEIVREGVLYMTHHEVPHAVATLVEEFKTRDNGMIYIACTVYVERDSQKKIVIGKGGQMIKRISTRARHEVEAMLDNRVYLDLHVKVMKNWRRNEHMLQRLGYRIGQY